MSESRHLAWSCKSLHVNSNPNSYLRNFPFMTSFHNMAPYLAPRLPKRGFSMPPPRPKAEPKARGRAGGGLDIAQTPIVFGGFFMFLPFWICWFYLILNYSPQGSMSHFLSEIMFLFMFFFGRSPTNPVAGGTPPAAAAGAKAAPKPGSQGTVDSWVIGWCQLKDGHVSTNGMSRGPLTSTFFGWRTS